MIRVSCKWRSNSDQNEAIGLTFRLKFPDNICPSMCLVFFYILVEEHLGRNGQYNIICQV